MNFSLLYAFFLVFNLQAQLEDKMEELGIGKQLREGRGHYKSDATKDRGR